jgi:hypothetical protein
MLLECYNPNEGNVSMTLTIRSKSSPISFQALIPMQPGFNRHRIGMTDIARSIDASAKFGVELAPNEIADGCTLFFGAMDFVVDAACAPMEKGVPADSPSNQTASTRFLQVCGMGYGQHPLGWHPGRGRQRRNTAEIRYC